MIKNAKTKPIIKKLMIQINLIIILTIKLTDIKINLNSMQQKCNIKKSIIFICRNIKYNRTSIVFLFYLMNVCVTAFILLILKNIKF